MMAFHPDRDQLDRFVRSLFAYADPDTYVSLRSFDQKDSKQPPVLIKAVKLRGDLAPLVDHATKAADQAANNGCPAVFAPPICTFSNADRARIEDIANGLVLSVEIDAGDTAHCRRRLESIFGPCTLVIASGSEWVDPLTGEIHPKLHLHWRLSEPTREPHEHAKLRQARDMAAMLVGADPTGKPVNHPLRWPGSWNLKGKPVLARIVAFNDSADIHLDDALTAIEEAVEAAGLASQATPQANGKPEADTARVAAAMAAIPNADVHYDQWIRFGYAVWRATGGTGYDIWDEWSQKSEKYNAAEQDAAWHRIGRAINGSSAPRTIGAGTIFFHAAQNGWNCHAPEPPPHDALPDEPDPDSFEHIEPPPVEPTYIYDPWNALQPVPFPIEALPEPLRSFVQDRSRLVGCDPAGLAWCCLSAASAAIHGRIRLRMKRHDNWSVPAALWVALIGLPSTKKTPAMAAAWQPLERIQGKALAAHRNALRDWEALPKDEKKETPKPRPPRRLVTHDATMESLQEILSNQTRGVGILRDELAGWIGSLEKYAGGKGSAADRAFALQSYNGGSYVVDRVMRGTLPIDNLLTVMCGGIQPDRLKSFGDITDDGLWQRFILHVMAPGDRGVDEALDGSGSWDGLIERLLMLAPDLICEFTDDALAIRDEVLERVYELEQNEVLGSKFVGFVGKLAGVWGRLCLTLHMISSPGSVWVPVSIATAARDLVFNAILPTAARVYLEMGGAGGNIEATQSIAGYILTKRLSRLLMSDLTSNVRACRGLPADEVRRLVSPLEAGGWLMPEKEFGNTKWLVSEFVHERFAARARRESDRRKATRDMILSEAQSRRIARNQESQADDE